MAGNTPFTIRASPPLTEPPEGYGLGLSAVYLVWALVVAILYLPCRWFADLKRRRQDTWLSYL